MKYAMPATLIIALAVVMAVTVAPTYSQSNAGRVIGIEHVGLNVADVATAVKWFCDNLDMKVVRKLDGPTNAHFIVDAAGRNMLELYTNTEAPIPDYHQIDPLALHFAFSVDDVAAVHQRLIAAGATEDSEVFTTPAGDTLSMVRSPEGIPIQLVKRGTSML